MKVFYFNDRKIPAAVICKKDDCEPWEYPVFELAGRTGKTFNVDISAGCQLYIKVWDSNVVRLDEMPEDNSV